MKKHRVTYHIYDDFGELIKISLDKPTDKSYTFTQITELYRDSPVEKEVVCRKESARFDTDNSEEAYFKLTRRTL